MLPDFANLLTYDEETGKLYWKVSRGSVKAGSPAGTVVTGGYLRLLVDRKSYANHHIVWWFETGEWNVKIDHEDLNKLNNKFSNLRKAEQSDNCLNKPKQSNNTSGEKGIHLSHQGWILQMRRKGKPAIRKTFATKEDAVTYRDEHAPAYYGEFYRKA